MMKKQTFSLLELFLVVAVVAITAGMLLPLLAQARENAVRHGCIDNLNRISKAAFLYVDHNNDYTVPHLAGKIRGWPLVLMHDEAALKREFFHCPDDLVKRGSNDFPISYSLNVGHLWDSRQSLTNRKEWGPASIASGTAIRMSKVPQPSDTVWFFENQDPNNSFRKMWNAGDRSLWTAHTIKGFHDHGTVNHMIFMDGSVTGICQKTWVKGDNRGIIVKDLHSPANCTPNIR